MIANLCRKPSPPCRDYKLLLFASVSFFPYVWPFIASQVCSASGSWPCILAAVAAAALLLIVPCNLLGCTARKTHCVKMSVEGFAVDCFLQLITEIICWWYFLDDEAVCCNRVMDPQVPDLNMALPAQDSDESGSSRASITTFFGRASYGRHVTIPMEMETKTCEARRRNTA